MRAPVSMLIASLEKESQTVNQVTRDVPMDTVQEKTASQENHALTHSTQLGLKLANLEINTADLLTNLMERIHTASQATRDVQTTSTQQLRPSRVVAEV